MYILSKIFRNSIKSVRAHCVPILKIVLINLSRKQETTHNSKTGTEYDFKQLLDSVNQCLGKSYQPRLRLG